MDNYFKMVKSLLNLLDKHPKSMLVKTSIVIIALYIALNFLIGKQPIVNFTINNTLNINSPTLNQYYDKDEREM